MDTDDLGGKGGGRSLEEPRLPCQYRPSESRLIARLTDSQQELRVLGQVDETILGVAAGQ